MSAFKEAAENIRLGVVAIWTSMSAEARAFCVGLALGIGSGGTAVALWLS